MKRFTALLLIFCFLFTLSTSANATGGLVSFEFDESLADFFDVLSDAIEIAIPYEYTSDGTIIVTMSASEHAQVLNKMQSYFNEAFDMENINVSPKISPRPNNGEEDNSIPAPLTEAFANLFAALLTTSFITEIKHNSGFTTLDIYSVSDVPGLIDYLIILYAVYYASVYQVFSGIPQEAIDLKINIFDSVTGECIETTDYEEFMEYIDS